MKHIPIQINLATNGPIVFRNIPKNMRYLTLLNVASDWTIEVYKGNTTDPDNQICQFPARNNLCLPLIIDGSNDYYDYTVIWVGGTYKGIITGEFSDEQIALTPVYNPKGSILDTKTTIDGISCSYTNLGEELYAGMVNFGDVNLGNITTGAISAGNITKGDIETGNITTGSISTSGITIGGYTNIQAPIQLEAPIMFQAPVQYLGTYALTGFPIEDMGGTPLNITATGTFNVKNEAGNLKRIIINNPGADMVITIYNNTAPSGTKIATISPTAVQSIEYGARFSDGLTIVVTATTMGDITIITGD